MNLNAVGNVSFPSFIQQLTEELKAKENSDSIWTTNQSPSGATNLTGIPADNNLSAENQLLPLILLIAQAMLGKQTGEQEQQNVAPNTNNNLGLADFLKLFTGNAAEPAATASPTTSSKSNATVAQTASIRANNSEEMKTKGYVTTTETDKNGKEITTRLYNNGNKTVTTTETDENGNKIITKEHSDGIKTVTTIGLDKNGNEIITKEYDTGAKSVTSTEIDKNGDEITTETLTKKNGQKKILNTTKTTTETDENGNKIITITKDLKRGFKEVTTTKTDENGDEITTIKKSNSSGDYGIDSDKTVHNKKEYVNGQLTSSARHNNGSNGTQSQNYQEYEYNDDGSEKNSAYITIDADTGQLTYGETIEYTSDGKTLLHYQDAFERDGEIIDEKVIKVEHKLVDGEYVCTNKEELTDAEEIAEVKAEMSEINKSSDSAQESQEESADSAQETPKADSDDSKTSKNVSELVK